MAFQSLTRSSMSKEVEAINNRLKQLEDIETRLHLEKEAIAQRRAREDEQVQLKRQEEDRGFLETVRERDREEDELRRRRRILSWSSFGALTANLGSDEGQVTSDSEHGARTRSITKFKRSAPSSGRKEYGLPTARDSQGRDLFTRPSDGKLVYLHCCVAGCERANFPNALALRNHVCSPIGLHKLKGLIKSNTQAIEMCGQVAPGQEEPSTTSRDQPFETAPVANMTRADALLSPATGSGEDQHQGEASSRSITHTEAESSATVSKALDRFKARGLGRAYRTTGSRTRAEEAAEVFNGFMSSDSEDSHDTDDSEDGLPQGRKIPADRIDQHKAATLATNPSTRFRAGVIFGRKGAETARGDSVDAQAIKNERTATPSSIDRQSERHASPKRLVSASEAEHVANLRTEATRMHLTPNLGAESIATRKRPNSAPPVTPPAIAKRLRVTDDLVERLVRSQSVSTGRGP